MAGLDEVAHHLAGARHGAPDAAREADDVASTVADRGDPVQRPRDTAAVVVAELGDLRDHLRELGVFHLDLVEVELLLAVARGRTASEVEDHLD